jgi:UDP-glucuronate 4-epimerase
MSRFVVTGAAGFIGSHLTEALLRRGDDVVAVDAFTDYYDPALKEENAAGLDVARLDLAEETLDLDGVDGIFHLAGQPGVRASWGDDFVLYVRQNVIATQRVLEAAVEADVRVVFASSSSVYGDADAYPTPEDALPRPISPYGITKLTCEHLLYAYRAETAALRYFTVYGPRQRPDMFFTRMLTALAEGSEFTLYGDGSASRSFTYVADAVEGTIAAMERGEGVYNVGGGSETTVNAVIALAERISGRTLLVRRVEPQAGDVRRTSADTTRIRADLGWEPKTALEQGLRAQWDWASSRVAAR